MSQHGRGKKRKVSFSTPSASDNGASADPHPSSNGKKTPRPRSSLSKKRPEPLDPPSFSFDASNSSKKKDESRYELWSVRLPASVDPETDLPLDRPLTIRTLAGGSTTKQKKKDAQKDDGDDASSTVVRASDGTTYTLAWGHSVEHESFRVLVPRQSKQKNTEDDDDSDGDDDDDGNNTNHDSKYLVCSAPFVHHINLVATDAAVAPDPRALAPRLGQAPPAVAPGKMDNKNSKSAQDSSSSSSSVRAAGPHSLKTYHRRAYQPVPQLQGLVRRWKPLGAAAVSIPTATTTNASSKRPRSTITTHNDKGGSTIPAKPAATTQSSSHETSKSAEKAQQRTLKKEAKRRRSEEPKAKALRPTTPSATTQLEEEEEGRVVKQEEIPVKREASVPTADNDRKNGATATGHGDDDYEAQRKERKSAKKERKSAKKAKKEAKKLKKEKRHKKEE